MADSNIDGKNFKELFRDSDEIFEMYCELCHEKGKRNVTAEGFCVNCVQYFCVTCLSFHKTFVPEHKQQDKYEMPLDFCTEPCKDHKGEVIRFYCQLCDNFICSTCKSKAHKRCRVVHPLHVLVANFENSREFQAFEKKLEDLETKIKNRKTSIDENQKTVNKLHEEATQAIHKQRDEVLEYFDNATKQFQATLQKTFNTDKTRLDSQTRQVDSVSKKFDQIRNHVSSLKTSGQRCKLYMTMKKSRETVDDLEQNVQSLKETEEPVTTYQYKQDQSFAGQMKTFRFGNLEVNGKAAANEENNNFSALWQYITNNDDKKKEENEEKLLKRELDDKKREKNETDYRKQEKGGRRRITRRERQLEKEWLEKESEWKASQQKLKKKQKRDSNAKPVDIFWAMVSLFVMFLIYIAAQKQKKVNSEK